MNISGPCKVLVHNGKRCNLYEIVATKVTLAGYENSLYYFYNESDAETYLYYLFQVDGGNFIDRVLRSKKIPEYEKRDFRAFLASLDFSVLENAVKDMKYIVETNFIPRRPKNDK